MIIEITYEIPGMKYHDKKEYWKTKAEKEVRGEWDNIQQYRKRKQKRKKYHSELFT